MTDNELDDMLEGEAPQKLFPKISKTNQKPILIGGGIALLVIVFAIFLTIEERVEANTGITAPLQGRTVAATIPPGCVTCPSVANCFPGATPQGQAVAATIPPGCVTCPSVANCFPGATPQGQTVAATIPPGCATCPSVANCFPGATPQGAAVAYTPPSTIPNENNRHWNASTHPGVQSYNLNNLAPPIFRDAILPHEYRGVCASCHQIHPDIAISFTAQMIHEYRGVCSNCHAIMGTPAGVSM
ncbi:MAG: hypothetical protein HQK83_01935 [Fibrobacteria bacterium]|nr:hypothetical protein [Fibrobacteria bacterium]